MMRGDMKQTILGSADGGDMKWTEIWSSEKLFKGMLMGGDVKWTEICYAD